MNDFIELKITIQPYSPWSEVIMHALAELDYIGFQEDDSVLMAYIVHDKFKLSDVQGLMKKYSTQFDYTLDTKKIESRNWNAEWEASFSPVIISNKIIIRALFHDAVPGVEHEILLTPKMAFGTGHHATTSAMMTAMLNLDFTHKSVFDVGCGTAILSILAEKLGASKILAIDNDDWAVNNAHENCQINACKNIMVEKAEVDSTPQNSFNVILANINRNVIIQDMPIYKNYLSDEGQLLLSGFRKEDRSSVLELAQSLGLKEVFSMEEKEWCMLHLTR